MIYKIKQEIYNILIKKQEERTDNEWKLLYNYISSISFFQKYVLSGYKNIPSECCKVLQPIQMKKGEIVFYINTEGNKFYIILQGEVGLYIKVDEQGPGNKFENLVQVKTLHDGDYFGELGLLNFKTRSATVQCLSDCYLAVIDKISFDRILKKLEQDILQERIDQFAFENPILRFSSKHTVKQLYFNAIFKKYSSNEFIIHAGDPLEAMFIIKSGQFKLVKEYNKKSSNDGEEDDDEDEQNEYEVLNQDKYFLQLSKQKKKLISILDLGKGQMFGYEDFILKKDQFSYGIICKEGGEVIMIRQNDFRQKLLSDKLTMRYLKQQMNLQSNYIKEREDTIVKNLKGYTQYYFEHDPQKEDKEKKSIMTKMLHNSTGVKFDFIPDTVIDKARAQELDDKKSNKPKQPKVKMNHFNDELSHEFQYNLAKNYQERFGELDLAKLKIHVPQEIVQAINKKLKIKQVIKIEKSPPQISNSVLDYVKLKTLSQHTQNSAAPLPSKNTPIQDFNSSLYIQTAKMEFRVPSHQSSPNLNFLNTPQLSNKYPSNVDSPLQNSINSRKIKNQISKSQNNLISKQNTKQIIGSNIDIDNNINNMGLISEQDLKDLINSPLELPKALMHFQQSDTILNKNVNQNSYNYQQFNLQNGMIPYNQNNQLDSNVMNRKMNSQHENSNSGESLQINIQVNEQNKPYNRTQKLKIFDSMLMKNKNNQINSPNTKTKNQSTSTKDISINEQLQNTSNDQRTNQLNDKKPNEQRSFQNNTQINILSPIHTPQYNSSSCTKIQLLHSDSIDSQQSSNTQQSVKSSIKTFSNYSSLFKPYTPKQFRKSSYFNQNETTEIQNKPFYNNEQNRNQSTERNNPSENLNKSNEQKSQERPTSSDRHKSTERAQSSERYQLSDRYKSDRYQSSDRFKTNDSQQFPLKLDQKSNYHQGNTFYSNFDNKDMTGDSMQSDTQNKKSESQTQNFISRHSKREQLAQEFQNIQEIVEQPLETDFTNKNSDQKSRKMFKRMLSSSSNKQLNTNSRTSFGDLIKAEQNKSYNNNVSKTQKQKGQQKSHIKSNSQIISDMMGQIDRLQKMKDKPDIKGFYKSPTGKKITLQNNKPLYKFEQFTIQDKNKSMKPKQSNSYYNLLQSPQNNSNQNYFDRTISQLNTPKAQSFYLNSGINTPQSNNFISTPNGNSKNNELFQIDYSTSYQTSQTKIQNPQKNQINNNINPNTSIELTQKPRPYSSSIYNSQKQQALPSFKNSKLATRPNSSKPIDFFQKILDKKSIERPVNQPYHTQYNQIVQN